MKKWFLHLNNTKLLMHSNLKNKLNETRLKILINIKNTEDLKINNKKRLGKKAIHP